MKIVGFMHNPQGISEPEPKESKKNSKGFDPKKDKCIDPDCDRVGDCYAHGWTCPTTVEAAQERESMLMSPANLMVSPYYTGHYCNEGGESSPTHVIISGLTICGAVEKNKSIFVDHAEGIRFQEVTCMACFDKAQELLVEEYRTYRSIQDANDASGS